MDTVRGGSNPFSGNKRGINMELEIDKFKKETLENARSLLEKIESHGISRPNQKEINALKTLIEFHN